MKITSLILVKIPTTIKNLERPLRMIGGLGAVIALTYSQTLNG